jgi:hypothetical protein
MIRNNVRFFILSNRVGYLAACRDPLSQKAFDTAPLAAR